MRLSLIGIALALASCSTGQGSNSDAGGSMDGSGVDAAGADGSLGPDGGDTTTPYPIDMGGTVGAPTSYKGLPLHLTDNGAPMVTPVSGIVGVVCIGMSNSTQECQDFIAKLMTGTLKGIGPSVRVVDCAVSGNAIESWNDPSKDASLWDACINQKLPQKSVQPAQVRVVYHKAADQFTTDMSMKVYPPYPAQNSDYGHFQDNLTTFAGRLAQKLPSVQAVYTTSRSYGGFAGSPDRGEPLSYEEGHALNKWLADHPSIGGVWHGWGPYIWAPDCATSIKNASGVCYVRADYISDGVHPAQGAKDKISTMINDRFLKDAWYKN